MRNEQKIKLLDILKIIFASFNDLEKFDSVIEALYSLVNAGAAILMYLIGIPSISLALEQSKLFKCIKISLF